MLRFALTRIVMAIPTLLIVAVSVFVLIRLIPGDPASLMLGDLATPASIADLRARLGLDQSLLTQFGIWFGHLLKGDLGISINSQEPILPLILSRFWVSAQISASSARRRCCSRSRPSGSACCCCCSSASSSNGCRWWAMSRSATIPGAASSI
jgi:ABC-type dipeptide/oligopeptide/nickel transport system permease component